ncbi:hypothetical protein [Silvimonas amylolytica]|uniref:Dolichyl-phosphate-mannose-protein mannosyltransferase n=1 Tax=Silvimonas amylolytica TaxID=449663 RepID=A0ABQ2PJF2_9NEIS|nr:hypothetical protein [Silvimonas amylolytica]GGP25443.1 hypothetical protein GCM10010971_12620 [Silvimonas amylolytica]
MIFTEKNARWFAWAVLLITVPLLYARIRLHSDSLFLESFARDILAGPGSLRDWKFTPAPAYVPDVLLYLLAFKLFNGAEAHIFFVSACQVVLLAMCVVWAAKKIDPGLSSFARSLLIMLVALVTLVSGRSGMWLYFYSTNNHFAALLASLLLTGLCLDFVARPSARNALLIVLVAAIAKSSTAVFLISFLAPALCFMLVLIFVVRQNALVPAQWRKYLLAAVLLLLASVLVSKGIDHLLTFHDPLKGRVPYSIESAARSVYHVIAGGLEAFSPDNPTTMFYSLYALMGIVALLVVILRQLRADRHVLVIETPRDTDGESVQWRLTVTTVFWMVVWAINVAGAILSGGLVDNAGFRYFSFPLALTQILLVIFLARTVRFDRMLKAAVFALGAVLVLGTVSTLTRGSYYHDYYTSARRALIVRHENVKHDEGAVIACLDQLRDKGVPLQAGVADYWNARVVTVLSEHHFPVTAYLSNMRPYFWMSHIGQLIHPERYPGYYYNFVLLRQDEPGAEMGFTDGAIRPQLPAGGETYTCPQTGTHILFFKDDTLNVFIQKTQQLFLFEEGLGGALEMPASTLNGNVGTVVGQTRHADSQHADPGYMMFGPYIDLLPGKYRIAVDYDNKSPAGVSPGYFEIGVFSDPQDQQQMYSSPFKQGRGRIETQLQVGPAGLSRFETRVWYSGKGEISIDRVEVRELN